jgi:hypothetical protein
MNPVSFAADIKPLFRSIDIDHMAPMGVLLDDYEYMSNPDANHANAQAVYDFLVGTKKPRMPIGGPFWSKENLDLYKKWMDQGYNR